MHTMQKIGKTGRKLADRFREHLRHVEKNDKHAFKPVARHYNVQNHSTNKITFCRLSYTKETQKAVKTSNKISPSTRTLNPHEINERFSFN